MGLFDKLFRRTPDDDDEGEETLIALDVEARRPQLLRLENALDALGRQMREVQSVDNPGWRGRVNEYNRLAGDSMVMRKGIPTREGVLDLVFEVRPVFTGAPPPGLESLVPLQDEVLAAAEDLRQLAPGEKGCPPGPYGRRAAVRRFLAMLCVLTTRSCRPLVVKSRGQESVEEDA